METIEIWREVEFRDGIFEVPAWLADLMAGLPTHTLTKQEAIDAANKQMMRRTVESAYDEVLKAHFGGPR
jgi:hypothetical protein